LWPDLNPVEHLYLFGRMKGLKSKLFFYYLKVVFFHKIKNLKKRGKDLDEVVNYFLKTMQLEPFKKT